MKPIQNANNNTFISKNVLLSKKENNSINYNSERDNISEYQNTITIKDQLESSLKKSRNSNGNHKFSIDSPYTINS